MRIEKKIWPEYFDLVSSGKKKYEIRLADFDINEGDELVLREWNPKTKEYTGREVVKKAGYVRKFTYEDLAAMNKPEDMMKHGLYVIQLD